MRGSSFVMDRALDPNHQSPFTGPQHQEEVETLNNLWLLDSNNIGSCNPLIAEIPEIEDDPIPSSANFITTQKPLGNLEEPITMTWDLENEMSFPEGAAFQGAQFQIDVEKLTSVTGEVSYQFSNPTMTTAGIALHVSLIEIEINGVFQESATTYRGINRWIPEAGVRAFSFFVHDLANPKF